MERAPRLCTEAESRRVGRCHGAQPCGTPRTSHAEPSKPAVQHPGTQLCGTRGPSYVAPPGSAVWHPGTQPCGTLWPSCVAPWGSAMWHPGAQPCSTPVTSHTAPRDPAVQHPRASPEASQEGPTQGKWEGHPAPQHPPRVPGKPAVASTSLLEPSKHLLCSQQLRGLGKALTRPAACGFSDSCISSRLRRPRAGGGGKGCQDCFALQPLSLES